MKINKTGFQEIQLIKFKKAVMQQEVFPVCILKGKYTDNIANCIYFDRYRLLNGSVKCQHEMPQTWSLRAFLRTSEGLQCVWSDLF